MPDLVVTGMLSGDNVSIAGRKLAATQMGGGAAFAAVGARIWSDSVGLFALAGMDYPDSWIAGLASRGVDVTGVIRVARPHCPSLLQSDESFVDVQTRERDLQQHSPAWSPKQAYEYRNPEDEFSTSPMDLPTSFKVGRGFHLAPMGVLAACGWAEGLGQLPSVLTLDSPWWAPGRDPFEYITRLSRVDCLLPSRVDVESYFREPFDPSMLPRLAALGFPVVAVKLGADGSLVYEPGWQRPVHVPAHAVRVEDTTGAGDAFCGGFLAGFVGTHDSVLAALCGTISASFVVETVGVLAALPPDRDEAHARMAALRKRVD